ncbi:hypothetical protein POVCU1_027510 [Plasmodium ovale curtisi]|uniref:Uncharacterized protein n=1 Tax=Plasmodium ovale curtisi TaxID=864141 RepID=A0A1A8WPA1_PLAOA|nr:hypothetical protein POVCU1_027510 [Plasmodium ovale curtisi]
MLPPVVLVKEELKVERPVSHDPMHHVLIHGSGQRNETQLPKCEYSSTKREKEKKKKKKSINVESRMHIESGGSQSVTSQGMFKEPSPIENIPKSVREENIVNLNSSYMVVIKEEETLSNVCDEF